MLQTLATVLTYWTFRKWIYSSSWLFIFWLLQLVAAVIEFRSVVMRVRTV